MLGKSKRKKSEGYFIVFEGAHGSGKTTQAKMLCNYLSGKGIKAHYTKEPYSSELIPLITKYSGNVDLIKSPVLMYLLAADRFIHVRDLKKWMQEGRVVLSDRYVLSSWVYQQIQGIPLNVIKRTNSFAIKPNLTFYIDMPLEERLLRVRRTHRNRGTFFLKDDELAEEQELYKTLIDDWDESRNGRIAVVNGQEDILKIHNRVLSILPIDLKC